MIDEERLKPEFVHPELRLPPLPYLFAPPRVHVGGVRYYPIIPLDTLTPELYAGVTSIQQATRPMAAGLLNWYKEKGPSADQYAEDRANRGSVGHAMLADFHKGEEMPVHNDEKWIQYLTICFMRYYDNPAFHAKEHSIFLKKMLWSWLRFLRDRNVKVLLVEVPLVSRRHGFAGQIDFVLEMDAKAYTDKTPEDKRKRVVVLLDVKTGDLWESYPEQLVLYKILLSENYPEIKVQGLYNWRPKDYSAGSQPTYQIKDQTKAATAEYEETLLRLAIWRVQQARGKQEERIKTLIKRFGNLLARVDGNGGESFVSTRPAIVSSSGPISLSTDPSEHQWLSRSDQMLRKYIPLNISRTEVPTGPDAEATIRRVDGEWQFARDQEWVPLDNEDHIKIIKRGWLIHQLGWANEHSI